MKTFILLDPVGLRLTPDWVKAYRDDGNGKVQGPFWSFSPRGSTSDCRELCREEPLNGRTFEKTVESMHASNAGYRHEQLELNAEEFYPRIWRGHRFENDAYENVPKVQQSPHLRSLLESLEHIESLFDRLARVFRTVHPAKANLASYGSDIRELLIIACTEVEAQWEGVLRVNRYAPGRHNTKDYCKLLPAMRLEQYKVKLVRYPDLGDISPFRLWDVNQPTKSLRWYNAYNQVKHSREATFTRARLRYAIHAVAGCLVMLAAQFGEQSLRDYHLDAPLHFTARPTWEPKHWYFGVSDKRVENWQAVPYPFP